MTKPATGFRFSPPWTAPSRPLRWLMLRAFGPREAGARLDPGERDAALDLAERTGLIERLSVRLDGELAAAELGDEGRERLRAVRRRTAIQEIRLDEALEAAAEAAREIGVPMALLKGRALARAGYSVEGARRSVDVDLLVPEERLAELQARLLDRGFHDPGGASYEHQAPPLVHSGGGVVELHRMVPGVRLAAGRSARFEDLAAAGELEAVSSTSALEHSGLHVPSRALLTAHALAHAIAQHGLTAVGPGFVLIADLLDLGWGAAGHDGAEDRLRRWLEREVSVREIDASLDLARRCAQGFDPEDPRESSDAHALFAHFAACACDRDYALALRARLLERPLSDRPRAVARLALAWRTLVPERGRGSGGTAEPVAAYLRRLLRRPAELAGRWRLSRQRTRSIGRESDGGTPVGGDSASS